MTTATGRLRIAILDDYQHVALDYGDWQALPDARSPSSTTICTATTSWWSGLRAST